MELRIIREDELDAVKRLSEGVFMYDGKTENDYFPQYFMRWAGSSNHYIYGLYVNGELVAAKCDTIFDHGKTLFGQGLRVSKYHRNKGYAAELHKRAEQLRNQIVIPRYPIIRTRYAIGVHDKKLQERVTRELQQYPQTQFLGARAGFTALLHGTCVTENFARLHLKQKYDISVINHKQAWEFAQNHSDLFVASSVLTDWDVYELSYENFLLMGTGGEGAYERKFLQLRAEDGHESFALCGITPRGSGTAFTIEIYSKQSEDLFAFLSFAFSDLNALRTSYSRSPPDHMWLWIPEALDQTTEWHSLLEMISQNPSFYFFHALYFEKKINFPSKL